VEVGNVKFERESWRKLYVPESVEHRLMSVFSRGLRDYLLRHAEEDGTLIRSKTPVDSLAKALGVEPKERKQFKTSIEDLIGVDYLTLDPERLWITRFSDAQAARSPGAERQAAWRATHPEESRRRNKLSVDYDLIRRLRASDGSDCAYCGKTMDFRLGKGPLRATIDHVVPMSQGGSDDESNLCLACSLCNSTKSNRTPAEAGLTLRPKRLRDVSQTSRVTSHLDETRREPTRRDETAGDAPPADDQDSLANRARAVLDNPHDGRYSRPSKWPEVVAISTALSAPYGITDPKLRDDVSKDLDLKAILEALADGYEPSVLISLGAMVKDDDWLRGRKGGGPRVFTPAVIRTLLAKRPQELDAPSGVHRKDPAYDVSGLGIKRGAEGLPQ
jgi:5-methylcytosine-specific restriction endonuclease McrA